MKILKAEELKTKSKILHEALRNYGQLRDTEKPIVVSAILLALCYKDFRIEYLTGDNQNTDGHKIFQALSDYMEDSRMKSNVEKEIVLSQFNIVKDRIILNQNDHRLGKTPLKYFAEFLRDYIFPAIISNIEEDILGNFYSEFIRFGGGDGQPLGVVLTPKHITELFCDLVDLKPTDNVFDPCCGTGTFLVSAMHKMILEADTEQIESIKHKQLHGIEIREDMFAIASTNMILRGDGRSNLLNVDFLKEKPETLREERFTVGFMNPPYSQAKGKDTTHLSELHFIKHLLDCLDNNARCVVIVPQSAMVGKTKWDKKVKEQILKSHTLESVITLNKETFYGVGVNPCIAVFTAHKPHPSNKDCKFINFEDDGFVVSKHMGLVRTKRAIERKLQLLDCWLDNKPAGTKFMVQTTVEASDEWLHSFYYFNDEIPTEADFEKTIADYLTFEFSMIMQGREYLFANKS